MCGVRALAPTPGLWPPSQLPLLRRWVCCCACVMLCRAALLQSELATLAAGEVVERVPARPSSRASYEGDLRPRRPDPYEGTWEILSLSEGGQPFLDRHDVWGWSPGSSNRPAGMRGFRFDS